MAKIQSYPPPPTNPKYPTLSDVICVRNPCRDSATALDFAYFRTEDYRLAYERATGEEARLLRYQYLSIEDELERAYRYVSPCEQNINAFSVKFADVLRSACGAYEVFSKTLYGRFYQYDSSRDRVDIYNYLSLDLQLNLSMKNVLHVLALDQYPNFPELTVPFLTMANWNKSSPIEATQIPCWWKAYNEVKHGLDGLRDSATLGNATAATAALFLLVETVFGFGILSGGSIVEPLKEGEEATWNRSETTWARLFALPTPPQTPFIYKS